MSVAVEMLLAFPQRIAQLHISEVDWKCRHRRISSAAAIAFQSVARWIPHGTPAISSSRSHLKTKSIASSPLSRRCLDPSSPIFGRRAERQEPMTAYARYFHVHRLTANRQQSLELHPCKKTCQNCFPADKWREIVLTPFPSSLTLFRLRSAWRSCPRCRPRKGRSTRRRRTRPAAPNGSRQILVVLDCSVALRGRLSDLLYGGMEENPYRSPSQQSAPPAGRHQKVVLKPPGPIIFDGDLPMLVVVQIRQHQGLPPNGGPAAGFQASMSSLGLATSAGSLFLFSSAWSKRQLSLGLRPR